MTFDRINNITTIQNIDLSSMAVDAIRSIIDRLNNLFTEAAEKAEGLERGGAKASVERKCYRLLAELDTARAALAERSADLESSSAAVKAVAAAEVVVAFDRAEEVVEALPPAGPPVVLVGDLEISSENEALMSAARRGAVALLDHLESRMVMTRQVARDCEANLKAAQNRVDEFMATLRGMKPAIRRRKADKMALVTRELEQASAAASEALGEYMEARDTLEALEEAGLRAIIHEESESKRREVLEAMVSDLDATTVAWRNARLLAHQFETEAFYSRSADQSRKLYAEQKSAAWRASLMREEWLRISQELREMGFSTKESDFSEAEFSSRLEEFEGDFRNDVQRAIARLQHHLQSDRNMRRWNKRDEQARVYSNRRDGTGERVIEVQEYGFTVLL